jgi:hypothetical protein
MFRKIVLAAATVAALSPAISNASSEKASAKACAKAFAASLVAPGAEPAYKFEFREATGTSLTDFYHTEYTFSLEVHDPKTGVAVARANCSTDSRGAITAISAVPLQAPQVTTVSQN